MTRLWVQGVVKNGQVVMTPPIDLPDGTVVTVTEFDPDDDPRPIGPRVKLSDDEFTELTAFLSGKRDKKEWPEFEARLIRAHGDLWNPRQSFAG